MKRTKNRISGKRSPVSKYKDEYARMGYEIALLCKASDRDLARIFDVTPGTIQIWKRDHPEFAREVERGKDITDAKVAKSLVQRCMGYTHPEIKITSYKGDVTKTEVIKHYPPDTAAIKFWMTNRQKQHWSETSRVENNTNVHLHKDINLKDIPTEELELMKKIGLRRKLNSQSQKN